MKIGIVTMEKHENRPENSVGSSRIRARWVVKYWDEAEIWQIGKDYDVMVFQKAYWEQMLKKFDGLKIFDICDPDYMDKRPVVEALNLCHGATCPTGELKKALEKLVDIPIKVIPDRVDLEVHEPYKRGKHEGQAKEIVWFGYHTNQKVLRKTLQYIQEYNYNLTVISDRGFTPPTGFNNLSVKNLKYAYPKVHEDLAKRDIALLPVRAGTRGKFKSNNKDLTCWALGLPVAKNPKDLRRFRMAEERNKEVKRKQKLVKRKFDVKLSVDDYKEFIEELNARRKN